VLAVVQDQQRFSLAERGDDPVNRLGVRCAAQQRISQAERGERLQRQVVPALLPVGPIPVVTVRADGGELHQPDAVRQVIEQRACAFGGQPGLPRAARPDQRGEPMFGGELADNGDIGILADEAGQLGAQICLRVLLPPAQLTPQQRDVQGGQLR
jgi:hypothetical protein